MLEKECLILKNKVAKNYIYNLIYQVAVLIIPLITAPYLSRILGAEGIGIYSYNYSIAYYFCLFVMLGINNYGNRSIAKCLGNKDKLNRTFCEIYAMQLLTGIIVLVAYIAYSLLISKQAAISLCYLPFVISYILDINWFFFGQENFKIILVRNIVIKIFTTIAIFAFVKNASDVVIYILIMSIGALVSQILVWMIVCSNNKFVRIEFSGVIKHFRPNLILFIPVVAVSIYRTMDKIMLGTLADMIEVGYYENAEKIISILLSFITALGTVMLPRMSALFESKDRERIKQMISDSFVFISFISSIVAFGVASIANNFVIIYYGKEYAASGIILQLLCITVPFISYANVVRMQILIPQGKEKAYVISCFLGAIVNLLLNGLLIPKLYAVGAAVGTIVAEFVVMLVQLINARNELYIKENVKSIVTFWLNGLIMYIGVTLLGKLEQCSLVGMIYQIIFGAFIYGLMLIIQWKVYRDQYINIIFERVKNNRKMKMK